VTDNSEEAGFSAAPRAEKIAYVALFLVAVVLCTYRLGARPFDPDEARSAVLSWKLASGAVNHLQSTDAHQGPLPYYVTALAIRLLGDSDWSARAGAAVFGLSALVFAVPLRRRLGRRGALAFLVLLAFSPTWLFFSRFLQEEIFLAPCILAAVHFGFRYAENRRAGNLYVVGLALGLAASTTPHIHILAPWLVISLIVVMLWGVARKEQGLGEAAHEIAALLRRAAVPLLTALILCMIVWLAINSAFFSRNLQWNDLRTFFYPTEAFEAANKISDAWWFYLVRLVIYEPLILFLALLGVATSLQASKSTAPRFERFVVLWAVGTLGVYAAMPNKSVGLLVHQLLPLALLAAFSVSALVQRGTFRNPLLFLPATALGALTLWSLINVNLVRSAPQPEPSTTSVQLPSQHAELLLPMQSTYDVLDKVMNRVEEVGRTLGTGTGTRVTVSGESTWPLSWYLRHYPVTWTSVLNKIDTPIIVVDRDAAVTAPIEAAAGDAYERVPFQLRSGWTPGAGTAGPGDIVRFLIARTAWSTLEPREGMLYVCKNLATASACPPLQLKSPVIASVEPGEPTRGPTTAVWGKFGSEPGEFNEPRGLAVDGWGNIYVTDTRNNRIQKLDAGGKVIKTWGGEGSGPGQFKEPCGVAVAPDGSVYVADTWNHRVEQFDRNGTFIRQWAEQDPPLWGPRGIAVAADGTVFVTDTGNKRVLAYTPTGERLRAWGGEGSEPGKFVEPVGIAIDTSGRVVVADTGNRRLQFFRPDGTFVDAWPVSGWEAFYTEPYIAVQETDVYVTDSTTNRFVRYRNGKLDGTWGGTGSEAGELNRPIGIAMGGPGVVYVSDTFNHRVRRFLVE
jgi:uncharacterized protein (TIGR03663 family)